MEHLIPISTQPRSETFWVTLYSIHLLIFIVTPARRGLYHVDLVLILRLLEQGVEVVGENEQLAILRVQEVCNCKRGRRIM